MLPKLLIALSVFMLGLSTATSSSDRQPFPPPVTANPTATPPAHRASACNDCHWQSTSTPVDGFSNIDNDQCRSCHASVAAEPTSLSGLFHEQSDKPCSQCHSFHNTTKLKVSGREFEMPTSESVRYQCRSCHNESGSLSQLSDEHRDAGVEFYHSNDRLNSDLSPSQSCMQCHSDGSHSATLPSGGRSAIIINTFASHPNECEVVSGQNRPIKNPIDSRIPLFENQMQCQSCHSLTSGIKSSLIEFATPYDLCLGCHEQSDQTLADLP